MTHKQPYTVWPPAPGKVIPETRYMQRLEIEDGGVTATAKDFETKKPINVQWSTIMRTWVRVDG